MRYVSASLGAMACSGLRIAGGEAASFHGPVPCLSWPWTAMDVPEFNDELVDLIAKQSDEQSDKWSIRELTTTTSSRSWKLAKQGKGGLGRVHSVCRS